MSGYPTNQDLVESSDKTPSMWAALKEQKATRLTAILRILPFLAVIGATGCTTLNSSINFVPPPGTPTPGTIQVLASSSIAGHPMSDDPSLRDRVAAAFQEQFPGSRLVESQPDMVVIFTIVDYVLGCLPNCGKFRTYRNWSCEVMAYATASNPEVDTIVFNLDGSTYNPFYDQASNCASQLSKVSGIKTRPKS
jgi:hypothetical protein